MSGTTTTDPEALNKSIDRALVDLNCYTWLLQVVPNPEESMAKANKAALQELVNDWRGGWSLFVDHTEEIVPFEVSFVNHRRFYKDLGVDMSNVPYIVLRENKMNPPEIISDAEAKERYGSEEAPFQPPPLTAREQGEPSITTANMMILGAGAASVLLGFMFLSRTPKRRTVGRREVWRVGNQDFPSYSQAMTERKRFLRRGIDVPILRTAHLFSGFGDASWIRFCKEKSKRMKGSRTRLRGFSGFRGTAREHEKDVQEYLKTAVNFLNEAKAAGSFSEKRELLELARDYLRRANQERKWIPWNNLFSEVGRQHTRYAKMMNNLRAMERMD
jgi:hypothetical protein